jgi:hypothetical protein
MAIEATCERDALVAFSRRLLDNYQRREDDATFELLWPVEYAGLVPLDRRFDGALTITARLDTQDEDDEEAMRPIEGLTEEERIVRMLLGREDVVEALDRVRTSARGQTDGERVKGLNLLGRIVRLLPADAMAEKERVALLTRRVLESLLDDFEGAQGDASLSALNDDNTLRTMMFMVSRSLFVRRGQGTRTADAVAEEAEIEERAQGHAGDEAIVGDLDAFREELGALPPAPRLTLGRTDVDRNAEQLGVYLYYLVRLKSRRKLDHLAAPLTQQLRRAKGEDLRVLRTYLDPLFRSPRIEGQGGDPERVLAFLVDAGLVRLVRTCGALTTKRAREAFPRHFGLFLDLLDPDDARDQRELVQLARSLGTQGILEHADALWTDDVLLHADRRRRLLSVGHQTIMPFARIVLDRSAGALRGNVIRFLRVMKLEAKEAKPLWLANNATSLDDEYLLALLSPNADGTYPDEIVTRAAREIGRWLRETRDGGASIDRRAYAVQCLRDFDLEITRDYLEEIVGARKLLFVPREARAVRKVAQDILAHRGRGTR